MNKPHQLNRRDVLQCISTVVGIGALSPGIVVAAVNAARSDEIGPGVLTGDRLETLAVLVERIIPRTDTPGARDAGVHSFINVLMTDWLNPAHRDLLLQGLDSMDERADQISDQGFLSCDESTQNEIVEQLDRKAFADETTEAMENSYFALLKSLTLLGYYTSEIGASQELIFDPLPGDFEGCVPYASIGRAWSIA